MLRYRPLLSIQFRVFLCSLGIFFSGAVIGFLNWRYYHAEPTQLLSPGWIDFQNFLLVLLMGTLPYWIYKLIHQIRPQIQGESARFKWIYYPTSILLQTIAAATMAAILLTNQPSFLFGPKYLRQSKKSPDGKEIAYLYSQGLFCGYKIFIRPPHRSVITLRQTIDTRNCDGKRPQLVWSDDSRQVTIKWPEP